MFSNFITNVKEFFKRSWSIFLARAEVVVGFVIGVIGAIDWYGLANIDLDAGFSNKQLIWMAIGLVIKGVVSEVGRRSGTVETKNSTLVPEPIAKKADIEIKQ